jgi:hypothetical protein
MAPLNVYFKGKQVSPVVQSTSPVHQSSPAIVDSLKGDLILLFCGYEVIMVKPMV